MKKLAKPKKEKNERKVSCDFIELSLQNHKNKKEGEAREQVFIPMSLSLFANICWCDNWRERERASEWECER